jgi:hypothetical protein
VHTEALLHVEKASVKKAQIPLLRRPNSMWRLHFLSMEQNDSLCRDVLSFANDVCMRIRVLMYYSVSVT